MKRLFAAIIALSYLCLSTGFTLHVHYCMGEQVATSFAKPAGNHKCPHCGMDEAATKEGCCHDEQKTVKSKVEVTFAKVLSTSGILFEALVPTPVSFEVCSAPAKVSQQLLPFSWPHGPPLPRAVPLHIRYCVFLI